MLTPAASGGGLLGNPVDLPVPRSIIDARAEVENAERWPFWVVLRVLLRVARVLASLACIVLLGILLPEVIVSILFIALDGYSDEREIAFESAIVNGLAHLVPVPLLCTLSVVFLLAVYAWQGDVAWISNTIEADTEWTHRTVWHCFAAVDVLAGLGRRASWPSAPAEPEADLEVASSPPA